MSRTCACCVPPSQECPRRSGHMLRQSWTSRVRAQEAVASTTNHRSHDWQYLRTISQKDTGVVLPVGSVHGAHSWWTDQWGRNGPGQDPHDHRPHSHDGATVLRQMARTRQAYTSRLSHGPQTAMAVRAALAARTRMARLRVRRARPACRDEFNPRHNKTVLSEDS